MSTTDLLFSKASLVDPAVEAIHSHRGSPTWEMARFFPRQGEWNVEQYLALEDVEGLIEFNHGCLEFLPVTTWDHQSIVDFLYASIREYVLARHLGQARTAPLRFHVADQIYREPDILVIAQGDKKPGAKYPHTARLLVEVVSPGNDGRNRDYIEKREEYATNGVPEYWIVDMQKKIVTVCQLEGNVYHDLGPFSQNEVIKSPLLNELSITPNQIFGVMEETNE
ncbi:Uma2 family endonuclease [Lacunimicrobium album]